MQTLRLILGDQLNRAISSLSDADPKHDVILLCEVMEEATYVPHHPKKIAFLFAAMRHFADELKQAGFKVRYVTLTDTQNQGSFTGEVARAVTELKPTRLVVTEPGEWRLKTAFNNWAKQFKIPVEIREDDRFLCTHAAFAKWTKGKKQLRMEFFYREMRQRYQLLMEKDGTPTGTQWNYDKENRKTPKGKLRIPARLAHPPSSILSEVLNLVEEKFKHHFGTLRPFHYAVTRAQALAELKDFIKHCLPLFGDYQDAMLAGEPYLYHSLLSSYLNAGLLLPLEICQLAEQAYRKGRAPLNAVEGFIRQILGWREYIRGIYWLKMPEYGTLNFLEARNPLPDLYWGGATKMFCLAEAVRHTEQHAYSHHIQRLMLTGNFALLAGLDVAAVQEWYLAVYSDAYEWVEMPNTLGMALFGDGGVVASKPYAASGKYVQRMSNYCDRCQYDPNETLGANACPFNALYWDFIARHEKVLASQQRMPYILANWRRFTPEKQQAIRKQAKQILKLMTEGKL